MQHVIKVKCKQTPDPPWSADLVLAAAGGGTQGGDGADDGGDLGAIRGHDRVRLQPGSEAYAG